MELHYTVVTVLFVVLVLVVCFVAASMFIPVYWNSRGSSLFSTTTVYSSHRSQATTILTTTSLETHSTHSTSIATTTTLLASPPPGKLRVKTYDIHDSGDTIQVGLVFENTYPVEVIVEKIYLNDTLAYNGSRAIPPWFEVTRVANQDVALMLVTVWINTGIKPAPNSAIIACGKTITVGNLTIYYRIPGVIGTYSITLPLELPECMIKECKVFP